MASQFQNRLVGISILVASVVIFLPTIIDGKKMAYEDEFVATPIHPELKAHNQALVVQNEQQLAAQPTDSAELETVSEQVFESQPAQEDKWSVEEVASTVTLENENEITESENRSENLAAAKINKVVVPTPEKQSAPESAWTIQLGAFRNAANINSLLKTLHKAGFQAHTVPAEVIDGELTRLFVGPDVSKEKLEKQLPRLKRLTKLEGKLYPFDAVNP